MSATCGAFAAGIQLRREALLDAIDKHLGSRVEVTGDRAGAHVALWPKRHVFEAALIDAAGARGVGVYGMSRYFLTTPSRTAILLGYSRMKEAEIEEGIRRLSKVF